MTAGLGRLAAARAHLGKETRMGTNERGMSMLPIELRSIGMWDGDPSSTETLSDLMEVARKMAVSAVEDGDLIEHVDRHHAVLTRRGVVIDVGRVFETVPHGDALLTMYQAIVIALDVTAFIFADFAIHGGVPIPVATVASSVHGAKVQLRVPGGWLDLPAQMVIPVFKPTRLAQRFAEALGPKFREFEQGIIDGVAKEQADPLDVSTDEAKEHAARIIREGTTWH
jgi:hypothetical protein